VVEGQVYDPAEDSFMLLDAALDRSPRRALEIGTGCGLIAIYLSRAGCPFVVGTDVSADAISCAKLNARRLAPGVHLVRGDLFSAIRGVFDLVLFNPPYLPVEEGQGEQVSWAGGPDGRKLIDPFIKGLGRLLSVDGVALLVESSASDAGQTKAMAQREGLSHSVLGGERFFFEELSVVEIGR
jgi:release factor glutamine methyltransferase